MERFQKHPFPLRPASYLHKLVLKVSGSAVELRPETLHVEGDQALAGL